MGLAELSVVSISRPTYKVDVFCLSQMFNPIPQISELWPCKLLPPYEKSLTLLTP